MKQKLLVTFAVVVSVFAVLLIADQVMAGDIFLPIIKKGSAQQGLPSGVLYIFSSSGTTTGNAGGRSGMNAVCSSTDPQAHYCNLWEIENGFRTTGVYFASSFSVSWVDQGRFGTQYPSLPQGASNPAISDWGYYTCSGWSTTDSSNYGSIIHSNGSQYSESSGQGRCDYQLHVSCCKFIP